MTMHYDVFNGDADGIISLLQLRFYQPTESQLVTGVKRDIQLLDQLNIEPGDSLTILDISMEKNKSALRELLQNSGSVFYADHHRSGDIPMDKKLSAYIDLSADTCTALIVDQLLSGQYHEWAIAAAYGDNLIKIADQLAAEFGCSEAQAGQLKELGTLINYNGYGTDIDELHYHPAELYRQLYHYSSPYDVVNDRYSPFHKLKEVYQGDLDFALSIAPSYQSEKLQIVELPDVDASRRVSGVFGNLMANQTPQRAHVILTKSRADTYTVSLRAPLNLKHSAGKICAEFPSGGGREAAAGINDLPVEQLPQLIGLIEKTY